MGAKAFLSKAFPFLSVAATAFGGPIGAAGASILGAALGKDVKPGDLEAELTKLTMTEEGRIKAAQAEQDFKLAMQKLGFGHVEELERISASDRDSARKREMVIKDKTPMILAAVVCGGYVAVTATILTQVIDPAMKDLVLRSMGTLDMALGLVLSYYFGSSLGSARKDETIHNITSDGS